MARFQQMTPAAQYGRMANRGQAGVINSISPQAQRASYDNLNRQRFFKGRDVPDDRLRRRIKQDTLDRQFKNRYTKPVVGSSNLLQMTADAPRSLTENRMALANQYGPTPGEVFGDMVYGAGQIAKGFAETGGPMMNLAKDFAGGVGNFLGPMNPMPFINTGIGVFRGESQFAPDLSQQNNTARPLSPLQTVVYNSLIQAGKTPSEAYAAASRQNYPTGLAMGGIASLN